MQHTERVGTRVATIRKIRGLTARELATSAHVSYSLLTKVESGHAAATPAFVGAVARALRVDVPRLTGQPYEELRGHGARLHATIGPLRRSIDTYDLPDETITPGRSANWPPTFAASPRSAPTPGSSRSARPSPDCSTS